MIVQIISTTDGKYIGEKADVSKPIVSPDGINFAPTKVQDLGGGYYRYSNSSYVIDCKEVLDG